MIELTVRLVFSLAVVLGLLLLCARLAGRRFQGRRDALVRVVHRQPISRNASVSIVSVGSRVLVLGATDQQVRLLAELDAGEVEELPLEEDLDGETAEAVPAGRFRVVPLTPELTDAAPTPTAGGDLPMDEFVLRELAGQPRPESQRPGRHAAPRASRSGRPVSRPAQQGALAGSVLSTRTWRQAWDTVTGRAS